MILKLELGKKKFFELKLNVGNVGCIVSRNGFRVAASCGCLLSVSLEGQCCGVMYTIDDRSKTWFLAVVFKSTGRKFGY